MPKKAKVDESQLESLTPEEILVRARDLISDPDHWCQLDMAQDKDGKGAWHDLEDAERFCMIGAISRVTMKDKVTLHTHVVNAAKAHMLLRDVLPPDPLGRWPSLVSYNDTHTHAQVMRLFDKALNPDKEEAA